MVHWPEPGANFGANRTVWNTFGCWCAAAVVAENSSAAGVTSGMFKRLFSKMHKNRPEMHNIANKYINIAQKFERIAKQF